MHVPLGCKSEFSLVLSVSRTSLYRQCTKQSEQDDKDATRLQLAHAQNPYYGVRRLSVVLGWGQNKTRRIRDLAGIKALTKTRRPKRTQAAPQVSAPSNQLRQFWTLKNPDKPKDGYDFTSLTNPECNIWSGDFTYISWRGRFLYLAANLRLSTREILGWQLGLYHNADLVCLSLQDALETHKPPQFVHSDQGSEYLSLKHSTLCQTSGIQMSASDKGKPWQNGFMERFFSTFKTEMTYRLSQCQTIPEVYEAIASWIYYYNNERIHTALGMAPSRYAMQLEKGQGVA